MQVVATFTEFLPSLTPLPPAFTERLRLFKATKSIPHLPHLICAHVAWVNIDRIWKKKNNIEQLKNA